MWFYNEQYVVGPCKSVPSLVSSFLYYSNWNEAMDNYTVRSILPICNPPSWFLSATFQLGFFAPLIFLPLYFWPKFGLTLAGLLLIISPSITILPRLLTGYPSYMEVTKFVSFISNAQALTHSHLNPLLYVNSAIVGLITGYLIQRKPRLPLGGPVVETGVWLVSLVSVLYALIWHYGFMEQNIIIPESSVIGWFAYYKMTWSLFLGLTTYLCCTGRLPLVNYLLTIRPLQPIARLSLSVYLLRSLFIFYRKASAKKVFDMYHFQSYSHILFDFMLAVAAAAVFHLFFEAPLVRLARLFGSSSQDEPRDDER